MSREVLRKNGKPLGLLKEKCVIAVCDNARRRQGGGEESRKTIEKREASKKTVIKQRQGNSVKCDKHPLHY